MLNDGDRNGNGPGLAQRCRIPSRPGGQPGRAWRRACAGDRRAPDTHRQQRPRSRSASCGPSSSRCASTRRPCTPCPLAACLPGGENELAGPDDLPPGSRVDADARPAGGARPAARARREDELPGHRLPDPARARRRRRVGGGAHREHAGGFSGRDRRRTAGDAGRGALPATGLRGGATSGRDRGGAGAGPAGRLPGACPIRSRALRSARLRWRTARRWTGMRASCASCSGEPLSAPRPSRAWRGRVPGCCPTTARIACTSSQGPGRGQEGTDCRRKRRPTTSTQAKRPNGSDTSRAPCEAAACRQVDGSSARARPRHGREPGPVPARDRDMPARHRAHRQGLRCAAGRAMQQRDTEICTIIA